MSKFSALVIMPDSKLYRMWIDASQVISILKEYKGVKVYRGSSDQEAILTEDGSIVWKDVPSVDKIG